MSSRARTTEDEIWSPDPSERFGGAQTGAHGFHYRFINSVCEGGLGVKQLLGEETGQRKISLVLSFSGRWVGYGKALGCRRYEDRIPDEVCRGRY